MARRTKAEASKTRAQILDAAEYEMETNGVSGASFKRIADRAGVTRGAIYWHFKDKDDLLTALVERTYLPLKDLEEDIRQDSPDQPPGQVLRTMMLHGLNRLASDAQHRRVCHIVSNCREHTKDNHPVSQLLRNSIEETQVTLNHLCQQAEYLGQLKTTPEQASELIMVFFMGVYDYSLRYSDIFPIQRDWASLVDTLLSGLFTTIDDKN